MADLSTPMLDQLAADFTARGWDPADAALFRMDGDSIDAVLDRIEAGQGAVTPEPAAPAPAPTATPPAPSATAPATAPDAGNVDDLSQFGAHADYIRQLRGEAARYRTERNQLRDDNGRFTTAFDGVDEATRDTLLALPKALRDDPEGTARWLQAQADQLLEGHQAARAQADEPLTRAQLDAVMAERDAKTAQERIIDGIYGEIESFGVDPASEQATAIMALAASHHNGDVRAAFAQMAGWAQSAVDQFVAGRKADAASPSPTPASAGSSIAEPAEGPKSVKQAAKAADAWLESQGMK